ncbi:uncharacterized protein LOC135487848 isoform X2 [Lineus longissimus]|uniref:uncharacterized protein LOC135487848 isoform X2 n=1 Tax=Lineus longissimus TaxID=88925 RepID=UPI00315CB6CF
MSKKEPCVINLDSSGSDCEVQCTGVNHVPRAPAASSKTKLVTFVIKQEGGRIVPAGRGYLIQQRAPASLTRQDHTPVVIDLSSDDEPSNTKKVIKKSSSQQSEGASSLVERNNNQQKNDTGDEFQTPSFRPAIDRCATNTSNSRKKTCLSSSQSGSSSAERRNKENERIRDFRTFDSGSDISKKSCSKRPKVSSNGDEAYTSASSLGRSPGSMKKKQLRRRIEERRKRHFQDSSSDEDADSDVGTDSPRSRYAKLKRTISPRAAVYKLNLPDGDPGESSSKLEGSKARKKLDLGKIESSLSMCLSSSKNEQNVSSASTQPPSGYEKNSSSVSTQPPENNESSSGSDIFPDYDKQALGPKTMTAKPPETLLDKDKQTISSVRTMLHNLKQYKESLFAHVTDVGATCNAQSSQIEKETVVPFDDQKSMSSGTASTHPPAVDSDTDPDLDVPLVGLRNKAKSLMSNNEILPAACGGAAKLKSGFWAGLSEEVEERPKQFVGGNISQTQDKDSAVKRSGFDHTHFGKLKNILQRVTEERNGGSSAHEEDGPSTSSKLSWITAVGDKRIEGVKVSSDSIFESSLSKVHRAGQGLNALSESPYETIDSPVTKEVESMLDDVSAEEDESSLDEEYLLREIPSRTAPNAKELLDWTVDLDLDLDTNEKEPAKDGEIQTSNIQNLRDSSLIHKIVQSDGIRHSTPRVEHDRLQLPNFKGSVPSLVLEGSVPSLVLEEELPNTAIQMEPVLDQVPHSIKPVEEPVATTPKLVIEDSVASMSGTVVQVKKEPQVFVKTERKESVMIDLTDETDIKPETPDVEVGAVKIKTEPGLDGAFVPTFIKKEESADVGEGWVYSQEDGVITIYDSDDDYMREMSQHSMMVDSSDSDVLCNDTIEEVVMKEAISKQSLAEVWAQLETICPQFDGVNVLDIGGHSGEEHGIGEPRALSSEDNDSCDDIGGVNFDIDDDSDGDVDNEREIDDGNDSIIGGSVEETSGNESNNELGFMSQGFNVDHSFRETEFMSQGFTAHQSFRESEEETEEEEWLKTSDVAEKTSVEEEVQSSASEDSLNKKRRKCSAKLVESEESNDEVLDMSLVEVKKGVRDGQRKRDSGDSTTSVACSGREDFSDDSLPSLVHTRRREPKNVNMGEISSDVDLDIRCDMEKLLETSGESDNEVLNGLPRKSRARSVERDTDLSSNVSKLSESEKKGKTSEGTTQARRQFAFDVTAKEQLKLSLSKVMSSEYKSKKAVTKEGGKQTPIKVSAERYESRHSKDSDKRSKPTGVKDLEKGGDEKEGAKGKERHLSSDATSSKTTNIVAKTKSTKYKDSSRCGIENLSKKLRHSSGSSTGGKSGSKQRTQTAASLTKVAECETVSGAKLKQKDTSCKSDCNESKLHSGKSVKSSTSEFLEGYRGTVRSEHHLSFKASMCIDLRESSAESDQSLVMEGVDLDGQGHLDRMSDHDEVAMETVQSADPVQPCQSASNKKLKAVKEKVMSNFNPKSTQLTVPQQDKRLEWRYKRQEERREKETRQRERRAGKVQIVKEASREGRREKETKARYDSCDGEAAVDVYSFYRPNLPKRRPAKPGPIPSPDEAKSDEDRGWLTSVSKGPLKKRRSSLIEQTMKQIQGCKQAEVDRRQLSRELKEKRRVTKGKTPLAPAGWEGALAVSSNRPLGSFRIPRLRHSSGDSGADAPSVDPGHSKDTDGHAGQVAPPSEKRARKKKPVQRGFSSRQAILTDAMLQTKKPPSRKPAPKKDRKQPAGRHESAEKSTSVRKEGGHSKWSAESQVAAVRGRKAKDGDKTSAHKSDSVKNNQRQHRTVPSDVSALHESVCGGNTMIKSGGITERTFKPIQERGESPMDDGPAPGLPEEPTGDIRHIVQEPVDDIRIVVLESTFYKKNGDQVVGILKEPGVRKPKGRLRWDPRVKSPEPRPIRSNQFEAVLPVSQEIEEPLEQADSRFQSLPIPRKDQNISLPALLDDFVLYILNWNYSWLKEQEKMTVPPPIIDTSRIHPNQRTFDTMVDYYKVFTPYIMLETWQKMFNDHIKHASPQFKHDVVITGLKPPQGNGHMCSMDLICKAKIMKGERRIFQEDDLVMAVVQLAETGVHCPVLAYVKKCTVVPVNPTDFDDRSLEFCWNGHERRDLIQNYDLAIYKLTLKFRKIVYAPGTIIPVRAVSSLSMAIRQFSAMFFLSKNMTLRQHILKPNRPNVFNESTAVLDKKVMSAGYHKDQADAICIAAKAALQPYAVARIILIKGPAGSGKSHMVPEIIRQIMKLEKDWIGGKPKVLLCAPNECALDNMVRKVLKRKQELKINLLRIGSRNVHPDVLPFCLDNLVKMQANNLAKIERNAHVSDLKKDLLNLKDSINRNTARMQSLRLDGRAQSMNEAKCLEGVVNRERTRKDNQQKIYDAMIQHRFKEAEIRQDLLHATEVICCVLNSPDANVLMDHFKTSLKGQQANTRQLNFTCAIIDEATSCTELDTLIPLQFGTSKLILLGDTEQLQASVAAEKSYQLKLGCSLFKRLIEYWHFKCETLHRPVLELRMLHRAGPEVMMFPYRHFYKQDKCPPYSTRTDRSDKASGILPYLVFDIIEKKVLENQGDSPDSLEMMFLLKLCETIKEQNGDIKIVILPPTDDLKKAIRARFQLTNLRNVDVLRYHSLQGKEYPVVIIPCFCIGNNMDPIGELAQSRKCLVALTRAQRALYICGRMHNIANRSELWKNLVNDAANRGKLVKVDKKMDAQRIKR